MNYNTGEPEPRTSRWANILSVPVLLLIGWMLYELTAQPALGVVAVCVKFGWEDFRTAWWLAHRDTRRNRARACCWLYIASGLWKTAITASLMIFGYLCLRVAGALAGKRAAPHVAGSILTAFFSIALATITACFAVVRAAAGGDKLWLHHNVHRARRHDVWPPLWPATSVNLAGTLLGTTLFAVGVPILLVGMAVGVELGIGPIRQAGPACIFLIGFPCACLTWAVILYRLIRGRIGPRVFAATPAECWQEGIIFVVKKEPSLLFVGEEIAASRGKGEVSLLEERAKQID